MKLLSFAPEVMRLRRIAKACMAGEVSRTEYRAKRRAIIAQLSEPSARLSESAARLVDDTVPRFDTDVTIRREYVDTIDLVDQTVLQRFSWWWIVLLALISLALPVAAFSPVASSLHPPAPSVTEMSAPRADKE